MTQPTVQECLEWLRVKKGHFEYAAGQKRAGSINHVLHLEDADMVEKCIAQLEAGAACAEALKPFAALLEKPGIRSVETSDRSVMSGAPNKGIVLCYWREDFTFGAIDKLNEGLRQSVSSLTQATASGLI